MAQFELDFARKESLCVVTDTEPDRLAPFPRQRRWASAGFGGGAARYCASPPARGCAGALRGVLHVPAPRVALPVGSLAPTESSSAAPVPRTHSSAALSASRQA